MERKPVELVVRETREKIFQIIRNNGLGVTINRLILQEIREILATEERHLIKRLEQEVEKKEGALEERGE